MEFNLIGYENGKEVKVPIPFDEIVKQFCLITMLHPKWLYQPL